MKYNKEEITKSFTKYINANSIDEKNQIINKELYQFLVENVESAIAGITQTTINQELKQDILVYLITTTLPKIELKYVVGVPNYIYQTCTGKVRHYLSSLKKSNNTVYMSNNDFYSTFTDKDNYSIKTSTYDDLELETEQELDSIKIQIDNRINYILSQTKPNTQKHQIISLLQDYINTNGYDVSNFKLYCLKTLKITNHTFNQRLNEMGILGLGFQVSHKEMKEFNQELLDEK